MRFFFSGEIDAEIADAYRAVRKEVEDRLNGALANESYGEAVEEIAIIPMILGPQFAVGRRERRLIKHGERVADYRLFIDFSAFASGSFHEQKELLVENVLTCIEDIARKLKGEFDGGRLTHDIYAVFSEIEAAP